ncbi:MAG TPA: SIS domain-containing protein [Enterococcus sp.]|nr:SIS domain-containing protein [Enterococcus sp.]
MLEKIGFASYNDLVFSFQNERTPSSFQLVSENKIQQFTHLLTTYKDKRILILGFGFSQNLAEYFAESFNSTGFQASAHNSLELVKTAIENETLLIVISNSGETYHLIELMQTVTEHNLEVIAFVNAWYSLVSSSVRLTISSDPSSIRPFQEFVPSLFFGNTLSQFELLMSETLKSLSNQTFNDVEFFYQKTTCHIFGLVVLF